MRVIDAWDLHNEKEGIAFHAAYLIDADKTIRYRKVARRRPKSAELLAALDGRDVECCASLCVKGEPVCRTPSAAPP